MKKILISVLTVGVVGALAYMGYTGAFFSDTETSKDNLFQAGSLDLKVDSEAHYNGLVCRDVGSSAPDYRWREKVPGQPTPEELALEHYNDPCSGTWAETDLGAEHLKFFNLTDVKPGDEGENTISLHVYDNDAWGRFVIKGVTDLDETCTEPESEVGAAEPDCPVPNNTPATTPGELAENITFYAWLDQGSIPGFQNIDANGNPVSPVPDSTEGDNIQQCDPQNPEECDEPTVILPGTVDENPDPDPTLPDETHNIWQALALVYDAYCDGENTNGHNGYGRCQGIADDGRLVGSTTYYFGLAWNIPDSVVNEAQTDSLSADLSFEVEQWRNNPSPF